MQKQHLAADRRAQDTLEQIARAVGFRDALFQYEPTAAAFDYESGIHGEERVLVADVGGIDFDKCLNFTGGSIQWGARFLREKISALLSEA